MNMTNEVRTAAYTLMQRHLTEPFANDEERRLVLRQADDACEILAVWLDAQPEAPEPPHAARERLAAVQHDIWAHWMRYLYNVCVEQADGSVIIPAEKAARWRRQMDAAYADLTDREQESDRHQADKVLAALAAQPTAPEPDWTYGDGYDCFVASVYGEGVYYFCEADVYWSNGLPDMDDVAALGHFVKQDIERGNDWRETLRRRPEVTP